MVDDEPQSIEPLRAELTKIADTEVKIVNFGAFHAGIAEFAPNIIVLDLAQGSLSEKKVPGSAIFEEIWNDKFCPLVVYTALPELLAEDDRLKHPFVSLEQKGSGSVERVLERIRQFQPHLSALGTAAFEIGHVLNQALREVAPRIFRYTEEVNQQVEMLVRSARRRVAASMDKELSTGGPNLKSWEHYLMPPATLGHPVTGDIIRKSNGDPNDPSQYAVVLTPSCDLVSSGTRKPKVKTVLVARCKNVSRLLQEMTKEDRENNEVRNRKIQMILTQGHGQSCLPLPSLPGVFPPMAADFRDLELIDFNRIGDRNTEYVRVASVDSPFRELVAWAYVLCAARPGLPDRDYKGWIEEVISALSEPGKHA